MSQPYVFQLFGTKKDLFIAVTLHCFERTRIAFEDAADRYDRGEVTESVCDSALDAMGTAYMQLLADRTLLMAQLQAYAACSDPDVQATVRDAFAALHRFVAIEQALTARTSITSSPKGCCSMSARPFSSRVTR